MRTGFFTARLLTGALMISGMALLASSCAQQVGDIDRTQPNKLKKSDFTGTWMLRQTIADVPPNNAFFFTGISSAPEKIKWEITEDALVGYRAYELVPGADLGADARGPGDTVLDDNHTAEGFVDGYKGSPVMAYPISSHFDVQRSYSTATGEQSNVLVENASDRYWNEREYMRVGWASQMLGSFNLFDSASEIQYQHYYGDADPTAQTIKFEYDDSGKMVYMEFTTKAIIVPSAACYYYYEADCGPTEVEIVNSFVRTPDKPAYEPVQYDDADMFKFGYFRDERVTYDRKRGLRRSGQVFLPTRHNIWETAYDENGNLIPMKDREPKAIKYYLNPDMPRELDEYNANIEREWNKAFTEATALAKGMSTADFLATYGPMFIVCHNPVIAEDNLEACGEEGFEVAVGDLRYNHLYWVAQPQIGGPLGYGPNASDPETGEVYSGTAYVYGASVDTATTYALDLVKFVIACRDDENSPTCIEHRQQVIGGDDVRSDIISRLISGIDPRAKVSADLGKIPVPNNFREMLNTEQRANIDYATAHKMPFDAGFEQRRLDTIRENGYDLMALDSTMVRDLTGGRYDDASQVPAEELEQIRPANWLTATRIRNFEAGRQAYFAKNNIMTTDALEGELAGLVDRLVSESEGKNLNDAEVEEYMWQRLRGLIYQGVMLHEAGHTLGLRHNFQGSYDSLNFHAPYWKLRKENMREIQFVNDLFEVSALTENQLAGRVVEDGQVTEQLEGGIAEYQFSTVMDYGHHIWGDTQGVGKYDVAAIVYAYTTGFNGEMADGKAKSNKGYVQVFAEDAFADGAVDDDGRPAAANLLRAFDDRSSLAYTGVLDGFHYLTVANMFGNPENIDRRGWVRYEDVLAGRAADDPDRVVEVPFMFCTDDWVGVDSSCHRWDAGADPYEQAIHAVRRYRNYYPLTNFDRDSLYFSPYNKVSGTYSRVFYLLNNIYQQLFFGGDYDGIQSTYRWMASNVGLNLAAEVMMTPNYGDHVFDKDHVLVHCFDSNSEQFERDGKIVTTEGLCYGDSDLDIDQHIDYEMPMGMGRYPFNRFEYDRGYAYYQYPTEAGHFYDYLAAVLAMTNTQAVVRGVDVDADTLSYSLPYFLAFDQQITRLFNSVWLETPQDFGPQVMLNQDSLVNRPLSAVSFGSLSVDPETGVAVDGDNMPAGTEEGLRVRPYLSWGSRLYPFLYGMAFFSSNLSLEYADNNKVFRLGNGEQLNPGPGFDVVTCTDPLGGQTYGALRNLSSVRKSAAVSIVEHCDEFATEYVDARRRLDFTRASELENELTGIIGYMNMMRSFYESFGRL